jgi:hypothetical protein
MNAKDFYTVEIWGLSNPFQRGIHIQTQLKRSSEEDTEFIKDRKESYKVDKFFCLVQVLHGPFIVIYSQV